MEWFQCWLPVRIGLFSGPVERGGSGIDKVQNATRRCPFEIVAGYSFYG